MQLGRSLIDALPFPRVAGGMATQRVSFARASRSAHGGALSSISPYSNPGFPSEIPSMQAAAELGMGVCKGAMYICMQILLSEYLFMC
jgi:hypothetical protein